MPNVPLVSHKSTGAAQNGANARRNHLYNGEALHDDGGAVQPPHQLGHGVQKKGDGGDALLPPQAPPDGQNGDQKVPDRQYPYSPKQANEALSQLSSNFCAATEPMENEDDELQDLPVTSIFHGETGSLPTATRAGVRPPTLTFLDPSDEGSAEDTPNLTAASSQGITPAMQPDLTAASSQIITPAMQPDLTAASSQGITPSMQPDLTAAWQG